MCETRSEEPGINEAITVQKQHLQQPWMKYISVSSIDATVEKEKSLGSQVALLKTTVPEVGAYARASIRKGTSAGCGKKPCTESHLGYAFAKFIEA